MDTASGTLLAPFALAQADATPLSSHQLAAMLQPVLADRFQLRVHHETRTIPAYNIVLARGGSLMKESVPPATTPGASALPASTTLRRCSPKSSGNGVRDMHDCTLEDLRNILEGPSGRYLMDKTGLTGRYDFDLHWTPDDTPADSPLVGGPSVFTAVQ